MFNPDSGKPAGTSQRVRPILVALVTVCLQTTFFSAGPVHAEAPVCQVPDMMLYMFGQGATMHYVGSFVLRNVGAQPCVLLPPTRVEMLDSSGLTIPQAHVYSDFAPANSVLLPPGQQVFIRFDWYPATEACVPRSFRPATTIRLTTTAGGEDKFLLFGLNGALQVCNSPDQYMGLALGPFGSVGPPQDDRLLVHLPLTGTGASLARLGLRASVLFALGGVLAAVGFVLALRVRGLDVVSG